MIPTKEKLLSELDSLPHAARVHHVSLLGRNEAGSKLDPLLDELVNGTPYEQHLGLCISFAMRNGDRIVHALRSSSVYIQQVAAMRTGRYVLDDSMIISAVLEASPAIRRSLLMSIRRYRRTNLAEKVFPHLLSMFGPKIAAIVLPACSSQFIETAIDQYSFAVPSWRSLAKRHPQIVLAFLDRTFMKIPRHQHPAVWARVAGAWEPLVNYSIHGVLQLVTQYTAPDTIPPIVERFLGRSSSQFSTVVFELLMRPSYRRTLLTAGLPKTVLRNLRKFSGDQISKLARVMVNKHSFLAQLLSYLPPSQRGDVFRIACSSIDVTNVIWNDELLEILPHAERNNEVERMLLMKNIAENRDQRLRIASLGSISRHREDFEKYATASQAEDRMQAYAYLVGCTKINRRGLTETLQFLLRLKNEQDPIRNSALESLTNCPPSLFKDEHVNILTEIVKFVAEARDTSPATQTSILKLANNLFKANVTHTSGALFQFSTTMVLQVVKKGGYINFPRLDKDIPKGAERAIVEMMLPLIHSAGRRANYSLMLAFTNALGKRAWQYDELQEMLGAVAMTEKEGNAYQPISLWLEAPKTREGRVLQLIGKDASTIIHPAVLNHLLQRRQDLLDRFINGSTFRGRFHTGKTIYLLPLEKHFQRWLPRQQRMFAELLKKVIDDQERDDQSRGAAIQTLAKLLTSRASDFTNLLVHPNVNLVEASLGALSYLDTSNEVLPLLLKFLQDDRARVAMYAIPRVARYRPLAETVNALEDILSRPRIKITVQKEVLRLFGEHVVPDILHILKQIVDSKNPHKDVMIAVGHAARALAWVPGAWEVLTKLADFPDPNVANSLLLPSCDIFALRFNQLYCDLLLKVTNHPDLMVRRAAFNSIQNWAVGMEEKIATVAAERVQNLDAPEWREAIKALMAVAQVGGSTREMLYGATTKLLEMPVPSSMDAGSERDLPARQRLDMLCKAIAMVPQEGIDAMKSTITRLATRLEKDLTFWPQVLRVRLAIIDWTDTRSISDELKRLSEISANLNGFVQELRMQVRAKVVNQRLEPKVLIPVADDLLSQNSAAGILLALELVDLAGSATSWDKDCVQRIVMLRSHMDASVRMLALQTWTRPE